MEVLFRQDWKREHTAVPDYTTTNGSFLRMAKLLKGMGIKNHQFFLAIHDQTLIGVDPFSPDLTEEQMAAITVECYSNFWYFIREVARAPSQAGAGARPFELNRANLAVFWLYFSHITPILIQPRQTGKSFSTNVLMTWLLNIRCSDTEINLLTKDDKLRSESMDRIKEIEKALPFYLRARTTSDKSNTEELTVKALNNKYKGHLPSPSEKDAYNTGRGLSSPTFLIDEFAFLKNIAISLPAALAGGGAMRELAAAAGQPYGSIFTTTSGKIDDRDGNYAYKATHDAAPWTEAYYDSRDTATLCDIILKASKDEELLVNCTFSHRQLGKTDAWLKQKIKESRAKGDDARRDYLNYWSAGGAHSPFDQSILDALSTSKVLDYYTEIVPTLNYSVRWFVSKDQIPTSMSEPTIMGVDTSEAGGRDDIALVIRSVRSGDVIAAATINHTNLIHFSEWLFELIRMYPQMTVIMERKSSGGTIIDHLIVQMLAAGISPLRRLYNNIVDDGELNEIMANPLYYARDPRAISMINQVKSKFGFSTAGTGKTARSGLYSSTLHSLVDDSLESIRDPVTVDQLLVLEERNNRVDHPAGSHDDAVIALLLTHWFLTRARNSQVYGIDHRTMLATVRQRRYQSGETQNAERVETLTRQFNELKETILGLKDKSAIPRYLPLFESVKSELERFSHRAVTVDDFYQQIRQGKSDNRLGARNSGVYMRQAVGF